MGAPWESNSFVCGESSASLGNGTATFHGRSCGTWGVGCGDVMLMSFLSRRFLRLFPSRWRKARRRQQLESTTPSPGAPLSWFHENLYSNVRQYLGQRGVGLETPAGMGRATIPAKMGHVGLPHLESS